MNLGYACICTSLGKKITTNRAMTLKTFNSKGLDYVSELALANASDIIKILRWNVDNGIYFFRLSSAIIPWGDKIDDLTKLKDFEKIKTVLREAGDYAKSNGIRITSHPGPFVVLTSPREEVVVNAIKDLEMHGLIFDMMGLSRTTYNKINIHCNGVYGDKLSAMDRFCNNYNRLSDSVKTRISVENDDKVSMYSVNDLMYIHNKIGIPIVFDYHHHKFCNGGMAEKDALALAVSTWKNGILPVIHYSESANFKKPQAHSDFIQSLPDTYGFDVDLMIEAKAKELAILPHLKKLAA
jgi:UV DNA damage endonuclease